jgi:hypothetical protein
MMRPRMRHDSIRLVRTIENLVAQRKIPHFLQRLDLIF